ncbi:PH domain-containing protein [Shewanella sp.]|uniref:PH domain-containing protein n=1 Tax=Shewanella sp. TaxID=50422 RepID=UPI0035675F7B
MQEQDANLQAFLLQQQDWSPFDIPELVPVDRRYPTMLLVSTAIAFLVVLTAISLFLIFTHAGVMPLLIVNGIGVGLCALVLWLCHRWALSLSHGVSALEVISQEGIWWQTRTALPYSRIQHVTLSQGPVERRYDLASLKCYSAGSGRAEIEIRGLTMNRAEHLRGHILAKAGVRDA